MARRPYYCRRFAEGVKDAGAPNCGGLAEAGERGRSVHAARANSTGQDHFRGNPSAWRADGGCVNLIPMSAPRIVIDLRSVPRSRPGWEISARKMSQSVPHASATLLLLTILKAWAARTDRRRRGTRPRFFVAYELAVRWDPDHRQVGLDPDVAVYEPAPRNHSGLGSVRTWEKGHKPPKLAIEVVSRRNPNKDYFTAPEKYAASGTGELWIFDPLMNGPKAHGGPFKMQVWVRQDDRLVRTYAGDGPAFSPYLNAWLIATDEGRLLRIADDKTATQFWPTEEEAAHAAREAALEATEEERAAKEAALVASEEERAAKEAALAASEEERVAKEAALAASEEERAAKEAALARVAELEALLAAKG